jgi:hypothetical protein
MWMIPTNLLCRQHLLGEHKEIHMLVGCLNKNKNIAGFLNKGLVDPSSAEIRHQELVSEMTKRGYHHKSPLPKLQAVSIININIKENVNDLIHRCERCRRLINGIS